MEEARASIANLVVTPYVDRTAEKIDGAIAKWEALESPTTTTTTTTDVERVLRYLRAVGAAQEGWVADNALWTAFIWACDDNAATILSELIIQHGMLRGRQTLYLIPQARLWLAKRQ